MLYRTLITFTFTVGLFFIVTNVYQALVLRLIQGILAGTSTIIMALVASSVDEDHVRQALGWQQTAVTAALLAGPSLGAEISLKCFVQGEMNCYVG